MKELIGIAHNPMIVEKNGQPIGMAEIVLMFSEPRWTVDAGGELVRSRVADDLRISMDAKGARVASANLARIADELEKLAARTTIAPIKEQP